MTNTALYPGPFAMADGLSFVYLGEMVSHYSLRPGTYQFVDGLGQSGILVMYNDKSWRLSDGQLTIFDEVEKRTLT